ncbi:glutamate-5-semialdehyde dehydrogenase [Aureococcus anophagefferens]|nr:glutamate-5-semialdehyde dehydrogenase [Aureococcus anophagefferens]
MFKKRTQKGQKRGAVAPPPTDDDDDDAAPEPIEAVQNSQYWRKRSKGLSAGALATREHSEKEAKDAPKEEPAAAPETIEGLMEKKYAGASGAASSRALHEALADFIARRTAATAEPPAPAPLSAEDALYVVPKLADAPSITHDAEAARGIGGGVAFGATGLAEVVGDDDAAEANRRRTARVVADLDRKRGGRAGLDASSPGNSAMRDQLQSATRIVIKAGTSTVSNDDGTPSLVRLGGIVEAIARLMRDNKQFVAAMHRSLRDHMNDLGDEKPTHYNSACAAAGQLALMSLYDTMFSTCDIEPSQFLVTQRDFNDEGCRANLKSSLSSIVGVGMLPIVNENDAVSGNSGYANVPAGCFSDNDGLAALVAQLFGAELLILLTDVDGLYDRPPSAHGAKIIREVHPASLSAVEFGPVSKAPRRHGGQGRRARALEMGVKGVVMASGTTQNVVGRLMGGEDLGPTSRRPSPASPADPPEARRAAQRCLQGLSGAERTAILEGVALALTARAPEILAANEADVAASSNVAPHLKQRLASAPRLATTAAGVAALAAMGDPLGKVYVRRELAPGLVLEKRSAALGVVLVIFEARPEALPQISALALRAGCALILKGGSEAKESNAALYRVIRDAVVAAAPARAKRALAAAVTLLPGRDAVARLLKATDESPAPLVDLVVPRGSNDLVKHVQKSTKVPVLGHADGVCHASPASRTATAVKVVVDAKTDYPAACNACETVLFHEACVGSGLAKAVLGARRQGRRASAGPGVAAGLVFTEADKPEKWEYGCLALRVDVVPDVAAAVAHVNAHSSGHTECVVARAPPSPTFLSLVDSADVFHNASTRFADGFRFGLGAELGIATGRIHARAHATKFCKSVAMAPR